MVLELFLQVNQDESGKNMGSKVIQRVIVEFDKDEMRDFVEKLESMEKEVIALSGANWNFIFIINKVLFVTN